MKVLYVESPILYFFLLILEFSLNFFPNISYKRDRFSKTLSKKNPKFVSNKKNGTLAFNLSLVLLPAEVDLILQEWGRKRVAFRVYSIGYIKIILALSTEIVAFHIWDLIIQVKITVLEGSILRAKFAWSYFWSLATNFKANMVAFCKFILVYIFGGLKARVRAKVWAKKSVKVLVPLIKAILASSFLLIRARF